MQTFLPYPDFQETAKCLDWRRLGKQRVEAQQILNTLSKSSKKGWKNHPAVLMWEGFEECLKHYRNTMIQEWIKRGYNNTMEILEVSEDYDFPCFLGNQNFHASHRSNLLRKDSKWYGQYGWKEKDNLPYIWPTKLK